MVDSMNDEMNEKTRENGGYKNDQKIGVWTEEYEIESRVRMKYWK